MTTSLPHRTLGHSGLTVSVVGLGCNVLGRATGAASTFEGANALVHAALDAGITLFDTADVYGATPGLSEEFLGRALGRWRDDVVIATKFGMDPRDPSLDELGPRGARAYVEHAVEASLRRLGTDRIDLYQLHTPDPATPIEDTLEVLDDLVGEGKVRYLGHSNFAGWQFGQAEVASLQTETVRFTSAQNHYSLLDRRAELEVLPAARAFDLGVLPYFPLARGLLTGKYSRDQVPEGSRLHHHPDALQGAPWDVIDQLRGFAAERGVELIDVAFGWLLAQRPVTSVIAGATRPEQVLRNATAAAWTPSEADLAALDEIVPPTERVALF